MDGLEAVAHIGQSAPNDDRHGIVEIRTPHLFFDIDVIMIRCFHQQTFRVQFHIRPKGTTQHVVPLVRRLAASKFPNLVSEIEVARRIDHELTRAATTTVVNLSIIFLQT